MGKKPDSSIGPTVRRAVPEDAPELARLRWDFRPEDQAKQGWAEFSNDFGAWLQGALASGWMAAVADAGDGALVGCVFLNSVGKVPNPGAWDRAWGYVTNAYVAPSHRGQGVGAKLLKLVIDAARERGLEFLIVWPGEEALSFYARAGFREAADVHGVPDDYPPLELVLAPRFYHGTRAELMPGDLIGPGYASNYGARKKASFVYLTATLDAATWGAELARGEGPGRIYVVEPTGPIEDDPNLTDKKFPGNPTKSYRTREPLRVTGEVTDWEGHPPEVLKAMKDHLEELERLGIEAIDE